MIKRRRFSKIFPGWWIVLTSGLLNFWAGGIHGYGFTALFKPIAAELGFSRATTSVAASIGRFEGGLEGPLAGWITDRFGPRWIVLFGVCLMSLGLILMNYIDSLWSFYIVWGVMVGGGANIVYSVPLDTAIANWFVKKRGLALSFKWILSGLSGATVAFLTWLIISVGWRMACVIGGVVLGLVGVPLVLLFVKQHRPEYYGLLPDGATVGKEAADTSQMIDKGVRYAEEVEEVEFTLRQAVRTPAFWLILVAQSVQGMASPAITIHAVPFLTDIGIDPLVAAGMFAMMLLVGLPFRLVGGFLSDRIQKNRLRFILGGAYLMMALGFALFLLDQTIPMIYAWFIVFGIGSGLDRTIMAPLRARYFGRKAVGSILGISQMIMTPVGIAAPIYFGWVYDTTNSYMTAFTITTGLLVLAAVTISLARPPRPPAEVTDIRKIV